MSPSGPPSQLKRLSRDLSGRARSGGTGRLAKSVDIVDEPFDSYRLNEMVEGAKHSTGKRERATLAAGHGGSVKWKMKWAKWSGGNHSRRATGSNICPKGPLRGEVLGMVSPPLRGPAIMQLTLMVPTFQLAVIAAFSSRTSRSICPWVSGMARAVPVRS